MLYSWGDGVNGILGHSNIDKDNDCCFPTIVPMRELVSYVACGTNAAGLITERGALYTWGQVS